jgi:hypothetical protein
MYGLSKGERSQRVLIGRRVRGGKRHNKRTKNSEKRSGELAQTPPETNANKCSRNPLREQKRQKEKRRQERTKGTRSKKTGETRTHVHTQKKKKKEQPKAKNKIKYTHKEKCEYRQRDGEKRD